jgi:hypothetical protein
MKRQISVPLFFLSMFSVFMLFATDSHSQASDPVGDCKQCAVVCEQSLHRIVIVNIASREIVWEWKASDSNIATEHVKWFTSPDEAKPVYGSKYILVTASGGVALVRIADKKAVFYAYVGGNPHSAEILPDGNIITVSSTGNFMKLFRVDTLQFRNDALAKTYRITDGHNVVWDKKRQVLWGGSGKQLISYRYNFDCAHPDLTASDSVSLPGSLHDLFPVHNEDALWLTTSTSVQKFNLATRKFETPPFTPRDNIKSVSSGPAGFPVMLMKPNESWWTDTILNTKGEVIFNQPGWKMYKARWFLQNSFSYPPNPQLTPCN